MTSRCNILIPDGDSTWALSVIQCLSQIEDYQIFVLSNKKRTATKYSKYTFYYKFYERPQDTSWLEIINSEIEENAIDVIVPIAETEVSFFIRYRERISKLVSLIPLPNLTDFEIAINKRKLSEFANAHNISHPKSFHITSERDKQEILPKIQFPILIKPMTLKGGDGIEKVDSISKLQKRLEKLSLPQFIQEFIQGYDIDCSVLCLNGKILTYTIQKGNLKGDNLYAPQLGFDFLENEQVYSLVKDTISRLNWSGVAHLDLRYDNSVNSYKLIEINARFWGSIQGSTQAGINFPHLAVQCALNHPIDATEFQPLSYMRLKGVLKTINQRPGFIFKTKYLMNNTEVNTFIKDPLPTFYKFREWLGRRF